MHITCEEDPYDRVTIEKNMTVFGHVQKWMGSHLRKKGIYDKRKNVIGLGAKEPLTQRVMDTCKSNMEMLSEECTRHTGNEEC